VCACVCVCVRVCVCVTFRLVGERLLNCLSIFFDHCVLCVVRFVTMCATDAPVCVCVCVCVSVCVRV